MNAIRSCPECGEQIRADVLDKDFRGICPRCLFKAVIGDGAGGENPRSPLQLLVGKDIGNYQILGLLGSGGMGSVYRARQRGLERDVALKILAPTGDEGERDVERFFREARAAANLLHPNIVAIHEVSSDQGYYFFTMELVEGESLATSIRSGKLDERRSAELLAKVGRAVHHAHQSGVVHRDLKPSNIMLDKEGQPKILDFGLARPLSTQLRLTETGMMMGTPTYMAPEQARGDSEKVDIRTDIYALGAVLYECLSGRPPFDGRSPGEVIAAVISSEPIPLNRKIPGLARSLRTICEKAMAKEPARRYSSAVEMAEDLERFLAGESVRARGVGVVYRLRRWSIRHPLEVAAALVLLMVGGWVAFQSSPIFRRLHAESDVGGQDSSEAARLAKARELLEKSRHAKDPVEILRQAEGEVRSVVDKVSYSLDGHLLLGEILGRFARTDEALREFDRTIELDPKCGEAYYQRVMNIMAAAFHFKDSNQAELQELQEKIRDDVRRLQDLSLLPEKARLIEAMSQWNLGLQGNWMEALGTAAKKLDQAVAEHPGFVDALLWRAYLRFVGIGIDEHVKEDLERASGLDPNRWTLLLMRIITKVGEENYQEALPLVDKVVHVTGQESLGFPWKELLSKHAGTDAKENAKATACRSKLSQLLKHGYNYAVRLGKNEFPSDTGFELWRQVAGAENLPKDVLTCPKTGRAYRGPSKDVNRIGEDDPIGMCDHGTGANVVYKRGDCKWVVASSEDYKKALEATLGDDDPVRVEPPSAPPPTPPILESVSVMKTKTALRECANSVDRYSLDTDQYPDSLEDLVTRPKTVAEMKWGGPYLKRIPVDGWLRPLLHRKGDPYDIGSLGADGKEGGEGEDADMWMSEMERK